VEIWYAYSIEIGHLTDPLQAIKGSNHGIKNFDGVVDFAMRHGLTGATEFVLYGVSAGGLATFLHADRVAARVRTEAPKCKKILGLVSSQNYTIEFTAKGPKQGEAGKIDKCHKIQQILRFLTKTELGLVDRLKILS